VLTHRIDIARFGRFRDALIADPYVVGAWSFGQLIDTNVRSLVFDRNHGTWSGTGITRGVPSTTIPEGELGATLSGSAKVLVPHDGSGFVMPGDSGGRTLSLAFGDGDVFGLLSTTQNDATMRCLGHKQQGGSPTGNGWRVSFQNGQLQAYAKVGGVVLCDFARNWPMDGLEHVWQWFFSPSLGVSRLFCDSQQLGADQSIAATELDINGGDLCFFQFGDGSGGGFVGTPWLAAVAREGNPGIAAALDLCRVRTAITPDIRTESEPVQARHGFNDDEPLQTIAPPGSLTCALDNSNLNEAQKQGYYTPGHVNASSGFQERNPIRWLITGDDGVERTRFRGFIEKIKPVAGLARDQLVSVTAETWLTQAMRMPIRQLPVKTNLRSDDAIRYVIDQAERPPSAVDIAICVSVFPVVFDDIDPETPIYQVLSNLALNEGGRIYERADGTLVVESRYQRLINTTPDAFWDEFELEDLEASRGIDSVLNVIRWSIYPRRIGNTADAVLASMPARVRIAPNEVLTIELNYRDEDQEQATIGGTDLVTPVATTDYTMTANEDGSGINLTAFAVVTLPAKDQGGASVKVRVVNTHSDLPAYFQTQVRGRQITKFDQIGDEERDDASVRAYDARPRPITFDYVTRVNEARAITRNLLALIGTPFMAPKLAIRRGVDPDLELDILKRDCGEMVMLREFMTGLDGSQRTFINGAQVSVGDDTRLVGEYTVTRAGSARNFWLAGVSGYSEAGLTTVAG